MSTDRFSITLLLLSIGITLLLFAIPLRTEQAFWRPPFALLAVLLWLVRAPLRFGMLFAWACGLLIDLLYGSHLGQTALAMVVCAYIVKSLSFLFLHQGPWVQGVLILGVVSIYQMIYVSGHLLTSDIRLGWHILYPALSSALIWPALCLLIDRPLLRAHR